MESEWTKRGMGTHITEYASIFAMSNMDLGKTSLVKHSIRLTDNILFKEHYWQIPPGMYEDVKEHLKEMLEIGAIWPYHSLCASPVILVHKKDGKLWFCIDSRKLNAHTIKDWYSLPRIEDTLDSLNGAVWFTAQGLSLGYWQVKIDEASKPLMAFTVGLLGFYETDCMPFGLVNAPATFHRLMETCLGDLQLTWCLIYLNNIIAFSKMPKDHLVWLRAVFKKLKEAGLKLKPSKYDFLKKLLKYLGHRISEGVLKLMTVKLK